MSNDAARHRLAEVLALAREQLADVAAVQKKQAALTAHAAAADGLVEVTVNAQGQLVKTVIDESYLDEHEFDELSDHITEAAQAAARDAGRRVAELMAPISERRRAFPALSQIVEGAPDLRELTPPSLDPFAEAGSRPTADEAGDGGGESVFPRVRR